MEKHKSPGTDQMTAETIKAGGSKICSEIHKLLISIWNKKELSDQWNESIIVPVYKRAIKQVVVTVAACVFCHLHTRCYQISFS